MDTGVKGYQRVTPSVGGGSFMSLDYSRGAPIQDSLIVDGRLFWRLLACTMLQRSRGAYAL